MIVEFTPDGERDLLALPEDLQPIAAAHLGRFETDWKLLIHYPAPPAGITPRTGVWVVRPDATARLLEFRLRLAEDDDTAIAYRVTVTDFSTLPDWVTRPSEWYQDQLPYPIVSAEG